MTAERDPEPYYRDIDRQISSFAKSEGIQLSIHSSNTLHCPDKYHFACNSNIPSTYVGFGKLFESLKSPRQPLPSPTAKMIPNASPEDLHSDEYSIPSLTDMGYLELSIPLKFPGSSSLLRYSIPSHTLHHIRPLCMIRRGDGGAAQTGGNGHIARCVGVQLRETKYVAQRHRAIHHGTRIHCHYRLMLLYIPVLLILFNA